MTRIVRAELVRFLRPRPIVVMALGVVVFAVIATWRVFASAEAGGTASRRSGVPLAALVGHGGGTEAFAVGASFVGFLVFVTVIALIASDLTGGTFRALLLREPHRLRVIVGKLAGILAVAAALLVAAEVVTFALSLLIAPTRDVGTGAWFSFAGLGDALRDYLTALAGVAGWAVFGTTLAVIFRSAPLALGVGFAWAGPFENIVADSWTAGYRFFPGQVLASLIRGGTAELAMGRALATALVYTGLAGVVAMTIVARRDVTS
jgi:ABC-2 type transport system permease protein